MLIPTSESIVEVSIVKITSYMKGFPASTFVEPDVAGFEFMDVSSYSFIIKHKGSEHKYDTVCFDLGVRNDRGTSRRLLSKASKQAGTASASERTSRLSCCKTGKT